jgi:hypothetical protein
LGRNAVLHVRRVKQGVPSVHPLQGDEMRALRELFRDFGICLHLRTWGAVCHSRVRQNGRTSRRSGQAQERSPAHASARLWLCPSEQRA